MNYIMFTSDLFLKWLYLSNMLKCTLLTVSVLAPFLSKIATISLLPCRVAKCNALSCSIWSVSSNGQPRLKYNVKTVQVMQLAFSIISFQKQYNYSLLNYLSNISLQISLFPASTARCKAVAPCSSFASMFAPWLSNCQKIASFPFEAHKCKGVRLCLSFELIRFSSLRRPAVYKIKRYVM